MSYRCKSCEEFFGTDNSFSEEGKKEAKVSGLCEECFDKFAMLDEIKDKCSEFIESNKTLAMLKEGWGSKVFLGGGVFRSFIDKDDEVQDLDLFFKDSKTFNEVDKFLAEKGYVEKFRCPENLLITYEDGEDKIQLIIKEAYNSSEDLVNTFDLSPCRAATTLDGEDLHVCKTFTSSVLNKVMKVVNIEYPVATLKRILKYNMKGYKIKTTQIEDFIVKVNEMELDSENMAYYVD